MNRAMASKKSPPKSSQTLIQPASKRPRKEKHINPPVTKNYKSSRSNTSKVKRVAKNGKLMNEWAENESSKGEIYEKPKQPKNVRKSVSSESVIYVGSYKTQSFQRRTIPIIDLTESSEHISINKENIHPKKLRTLYFPERNFDRMTKLRKCLTTTSLITIPVTKKIEMPSRQLSTTDLMKKLNNSKLAPLDIPAKYVDWSDINISQKSRAVLDKVKLTESDYEMIDWIIENDRGVEMEFSLSPSTSGYDSSINQEVPKISKSRNTPSRTSIEQIQNKTIVSPNDNERTIVENPEEPLCTLKELFKCVKRIETLVKSSMTKTEILSEKLDSLRDVVQRSIPNDINTQNMIIECVSTVEDLRDLDKKLLEDDIFSEMCNKMKFIGGKDVGETIRRMLDKIIAHKLSLVVNWSGRNEKFPFKSLENLTRLILVSARNNPRCEKISEFEVQTIIKTWFRSAGDREGGREKRRKT